MLLFSKRLCCFHDTNGLLHPVCQQETRHTEAGNRHFFIPGHLIIRIIKLSFGREVLAANSLLNLKEISSAAPGQYRSDKSPSRCVPWQGAARGMLPSLPVECFSIGLGDKGGTSCLPKAYGPAEREDLNLIT